MSVRWFRTLAGPFAVRDGPNTTNGHEWGRRRAKGRTKKDEGKRASTKKLLTVIAYSYDLIIAGAELIARVNKEDSNIL